MTRLARICAALLLAGALPATGQESAPDDVLWVPEGYHILSEGERQSLSADEIRAIATRNTELLNSSVEAMSPEERQQAGLRLEEYRRGHELTQPERQYVTMMQMRLLAGAISDQDRRRREERQERFEKLIRDQEQTTKGFPAEAEPVTKEADAIEMRLGKEDATVLYLRALKPLRARPWNEAIRVAFRKIIRGQPDLIEAALQFCAARQKEKPEEGAWFSLEAFIRLSMKDDVEQSRRLFEVAIQKNSRDVESRVFPLLLAEIEGDTKAIARLRSRAVEAWPDPARLDQVLFESVEVLPPSLQAKAHDTFELKYGKQHPTDWEARLRRIWDSLEDNPHDLRRRERLPEIERDAESVLLLPATLLPQPYRMEFLAAALVARARLGRCDEAEGGLAALDREIAAAKPSMFDAGGPPPPRTPTDVQAARRSLAELETLRVKLQQYLETGRIRDLPELQDVPAGERRAAVESMLAELGLMRGEVQDLLAAAPGDDAAIAAAWSRREREEWEKERRVDKYAQYDIPSSADVYRIRARSSVGKCLLDRSDLERAVRVLQPCFGDRRNLHRACVEPLVDKGIALANTGQVAPAVAIFRLLEPFSVEDGRLEQLRQAIARASPGALPTPAPSSRPTPQRPPA